MDHLKRAPLVLLLPTFAAAAACAPPAEDEAAFESTDDGEFRDGTPEPGRDEPPRTPPDGPPVSIRSPDIRIAAIDVVLVDESDDEYEVTVTVANGSDAGSFMDYQGGGELYFRTENSTHDMGSGGFPDPGVELAREPIPAIGGGKTWEFTATYHGRTTYVAELRPIPAPPDWPDPDPLVDSDPSNNTKVVSTLCDLDVTLTDAMLRTEPFGFLQDMSDIDVLLTFDEADDPDLEEYEADYTSNEHSHVSVPGLLDKPMTLNEFFYETKLNMHYYYLAQYMYSESSSVEIANSGLRVCLDFETDGPEELHGVVDGGPDSNLPDADATELAFCIDFPLGFDETSRLATVGAPKVEVTGTWNVTIGIDYDKSEEINAKFQEKVLEYLGTDEIREELGAGVTWAIHEHLLSDEHGNHGEIIDFAAVENRIELQAKSASGMLAYCSSP